MLYAGIALAQVDPGDPGANVNIVGPTPDPADIRDEKLKQQNEPSCTIRPGNGACIICAFNDYRTVVHPLIQEAWQGVAMSCDAGTTWFSRVAPGHAAHAAPIDAAFAADPRMVAIPGMAIFNFIGGYRQDNRGVLAVQHWLEVSKEDADYNEPALRTVIADSGTSGRFIDKPELLALMESESKQGTMTLSFEMENPALGTIQRQFPTGDLFVAFAVFTGSNSVKVLVKQSSDWGLSWPNQVVKLSEDQNLVSGISMTAIGDTVLAVWRRAGDVNDLDSIMFAYTTNRGQKWTKAAVLSDICRFDQATTSSNELVAFRTNDFPWAANDGKNFYVFYSDRNWDGGDSCTAGRPRIVMKHATNVAHLDTSAVRAIDDGPDATHGFQFMPAAFGARGKVQVAWYDTRREEISGGPDVVGDYFDPSASANVHRKVDVYTARIVSDARGGNVQVSAPVRVSQFRIAAEVVGEDEDAEITGSTAIEGEASFGNAKLYASGSAAFLGDYLAVGAEEFRQTADGKWISNASPVDDPLTDKTDFFVAWADNRDVRGNIFDPTTLDNTVPYTPPQNTAAGMADAPSVEPLQRIDDADEASSEALRDKSKTAEGLEDPFDPMPMECSQLDPQDRTRDANVYGAMIRDRVRLIAPTPSKPLTNLQRAFAVAVRNSNNASQSYRLRIAGQPADAPSLGRASFRQLPSVAPFDGLPGPVIEENLTVPARSTFARTVFVVSNLYELSPAQTAVPVLAFDQACAETNPTDYYQGACGVLARITLGGAGTSGSLQQPDFDSPICDESDPDSDCTEDVLQAELHNPELANPELANPELANPELANPELLNPELANPELANPELLNPELANLGFQNPELANPELANPELANPELANPELANPELANAVLGDDGAPVDGTTWVDFTVPVVNTGNVTTALDADLTLTGTLDGVDSQIIASTIYITPTSRNCNYVPQIQQRVLATVNSPDNSLSVASIDMPFEGSVSAIAAPGQTIFFTRRVFGTAEELQDIALAGFVASSQAANCSQTDRPDGNTDPYFCQLSLATDREQILLDVEPPVFLVPPDPNVIIEADRPGGACVNLTGSNGGLGLVTASDNGVDVAVSCIAARTGQALCGTDPDSQDLPIPLNMPGDPTEIECSASDDHGNTASVSLFVDVQDNNPPTFLPPLDMPPLVINVDASPGSNDASVPFGPFTASDSVDEAVVVSCVPASGSTFGIGQTTVVCTASDDGFNAYGAVNSVQAAVSINVADTTPPTGIAPAITSFEANAPGGAIVNYTLPVFSDNFDAVVSAANCTPPPGSFFALTPPGPTSTTVSCEASDTYGNPGSLSFDVTINDTRPPSFTSAPTGPVIVVANASGYGTLDFESQVMAEDADGVDPSPVITCSAGSIASGEPIPFGTHNVSCTATDASGNASAPAVFVVKVQYGSSFGIYFSKGQIKAGSTVPLSFGWNDASGAPVDSSNAAPVVSARDCATGTVVLAPSEFPGNSDLRYDASQRTWKYNWQTVFSDGSPIPASQGGTDYCLQATSQLTGQTVPDSGYTVLKVRR
jgi:HYR domain